MPDAPSHGAWLQGWFMIVEWRAGCGETRTSGSGRGMGELAHWKVCKTLPSLLHEIPHRAPKIGRSPRDCGKLETYWASGCSTISFSVMTVSIVSPIRAGRCEATAKVLSHLTSIILLST